MCFIAGVIMLAQYFFPSLEFLYENALIWGRVITAFAMLLGMLSLWRVHQSKIKRKAANWQYSVITLSALVFMLAAGILTKGKYLAPVEGQKGLAHLLGQVFGSHGLAVLSKVFDFDALFMNIQIPIQATMFSLLAFYIASAAFRAFKARTFEATLLLVAAAIVMLGRVPIGALIPNIPLGFMHLNIDVQTVTAWILDVPNTAAKRGIMIGVGLGMVSTALKIVLGIERTYLGGGD